MAVEVVDVDNADMWQSATEEPKQETPPAETPKTEEPRARNELGQFVKQDKPPEAAPTQQPAEQPTQTEEAQVPSWRLREIREERDAASKQFADLQRQYAADRQTMAEMQRQLQEFQKPKQEPIDFFQNPDGALQQRLTPHEERLAKLEGDFTFKMSRALAIVSHGKDAVAEMERFVKENAQTHPGMASLGAQMNASDDPVGVAMEWYQREKLQKETGGNLATYKQKVSDELLKDPAFLAKAIEAAKGQAQANSQGQPPPVKLPVSLSKVSGTSASADVDDNDDSSQAMWRSATAGMRR